MAASSMDLGDNNNMSEEEGDLDDAAHEKLISSIYALDGKSRKKNVVRGVPVGSTALDFAVHANTEHHKLGPDDLKIKKKNVTSQLRTPSSSFQTEKARRQLARQSMVAEANKWDPIVKEIRLAPQTIFSQREHGLKMHEALKPKAFVPRTPLEQELYAALGKSEDLITPDRELTVAEEKALKAMSLKEARARRAELMKHHELLSRMELKAKRQKRIKSKRYRKILRREKTAEEKKELERLQQSDPEAFMEKMELLERARMEERLTLKHRGGGKFSRMHKAYSKFDDKTRSAIQDMLQKSREITQRRQDVQSDDDDDNKEDNQEEKDAETSDKAPRLERSATVPENVLKSLSKKAGGWLDGPKPQTVRTNLSEDMSMETSISPGEELSESERRIEHSAEPSTKTPDRAEIQNVGISGDNDDDDDEEEMAAPVVAKLTTTTSGKRGLSPEPSDQAEEGPKKKKKKKNKKKQAGAEVDLTPVRKVKEVTLQSVGEENNEDQQEEEEDDTLRVTMEELFADEDFVEEFAREKAEAEAKAKPKLEDAKLPGWGSWAGPDYKDRQTKVQSKKKKPRAKQAASQAREVNVWLNPKRDDSIRKLQPKKVPFPYTSVQQYEASLRQPVSRGFVRESAFKLLNKPEVVTKLGHIIKPLNKHDYFGDKDVDAAEDDDKNFGHNAKEAGSKKSTGKRKSVR